MASKQTQAGQNRLVVATDALRGPGRRKLIKISTYPVYREGDDIILNMDRHA